MFDPGFESRALRTNLLPLEAYLVEAEQHIDDAKTVAEMDEKLATLWQTVQKHYPDDAART
ncbi:MAG: hypothetical protein AAF669_08240 [Pseudomonadota bacterium]